MEFPDLPALVRASRAQRGVIVALDNTWGAGLAFDPFALAGDGEARAASTSRSQALTKYPSGGADVLMGSVTTRDEALHQRLKFDAHAASGWGVGANDVELVLRSLPSLPLRYAAQDAPAARSPQWWSTRPEVVAACCTRRCPARPGTSTGRALLQRRRRAVLGRLRRALSPAAQVDAFVDALQAVPDRLFVGRAGQPGRALRPRRRMRARPALAPARWCASRSASRRSRT